MAEVRHLPQAHRSATCTCGWVAPYTVEVKFSKNVHMNAWGPESAEIMVSFFCPTCGKGPFFMSKALG